MLNEKAWSSCHPCVTTTRLCWLGGFVGGGGGVGESGVGMAVVKLLVGGSNREPFRAKMLPPLENRVGRKDKLIALSRQRFAMPREKIEAKLRRWMNHQPFPNANLPE